MDRWKRRRFLRDHQGQEPDLVEKIAASPLGMAVYRYVELLKEAGHLNKSNNDGIGECKGLLEKITGAQVGDGADSFLEERESSPEIPLRRYSIKRKRQVEHFDRDSSPEVPLATIQKRRKAAEARVERESSPDVLQMDMCSSRRKGLPAARIPSAVHANTAVQGHYSSGSTNATAASTPLDVGIASQPTSCLDLDLPLWDDFMKDADTNAGATDVDLPDLSSMLRELQNPFTPFGNVATEAEGLVQHEQGVQPPAMPDDHFLNQDPNFRQDRLVRENSGQRSASQASVPLVGLPGSTLPSTTSNFPRLITQPLHSNRMHPHHQWHEPRRMDRQDRRDSVLQHANGSFLLTTSIHPTRSVTQTFDQMAQRPSAAENMLPPGFAPARICMPHAMHPDIEPPTVENTMDQTTALSGLSALFDEELRVAHRARLEMYRRETGGMGGLPQVEFARHW
ncbi:hypothetical protein PRZ48_009518 [Zasmidium cellare]|uniref:Uncharacterized protein n=1 Tax=Zasmidium cellare TaxID=395010 RepID=A0ABR0EBX8_ZASCE|nr:hypothetical protein PRZ48_009518 [Zasmidium cellare]